MPRFVVLYIDFAGSKYACFLSLLNVGSSTSKPYIFALYIDSERINAEWLFFFFTEFACAYASKEPIEPA